MRSILLTFLLVHTVISPLSAQSVSVETYTIKVVTLAGNRLRGVLEDVSDTHLMISDDYESARYSHGSVPLRDVKKIVLRQRDRRRAALTGAIIGGLATGYFAVHSTRKNGFRSPVLYGLNLVFAVGAGAAAGALAGYKIGKQSRRVIRPGGFNAENAIESLRPQLEPFTYRHQHDILNYRQP